MAARSVRNRAAIGAVAGVAGLVVVAAAVAVGAMAHLARVVITPPRERKDDILVLGVGADTVTLSATEETRVRGRYGFWFTSEGGYARLGEIVASDGDSVTRELLGVDFGDLGLATHGRYTGAFYRHPRELGLPVEDVEVAIPIGTAPAWLVPAERASGDWVIQVHGRGVTRTETIRAVPVFHEAGYNALLVSYRNDGVASDSADGRYALGGTEWHDLDSAVEFAISRGAKRIVLMGWSMGGAMALQAAILSPHRRLFRGLVLESPVVDWRSVLDFQARQQKVPRPLRRGALHLLGNRWGRLLTGQAQPIDLDSLDLVERADELALPTLLLHSADDSYVPVAASRELARLRPDLVSYEEFAGALHAKLWNHDPDRFASAISRWLAGLTEASGRTARSTRPSAADRA